MSKRTRTPAHPINVPVGDWRAIPGHIDLVRSSVIDTLSREQLTQLTEIAGSISSALDPEGRFTSRLN